MSYQIVFCRFGFPSDTFSTILEVLPHTNRVSGNGIASHILAIKKEVGPIFLNFKDCHLGEK